MTVFDFSPRAIAELAQADAARALAEDVATGDLTAGLVDPSRRARARVLAMRSPELARRATLTAGMMYLTVGLIPVGLGLVAAQYIGTIDAQVSRTNDPNGGISEKILYGELSGGQKRRLHTAIA